MSIIIPVVPVDAVAISRRTWRVQIETPKGQPATIEGFRESVLIDAAGNATEEPKKEFTPLVFIVSPETLLEIPEEYRCVPELLSAFMDYLEQREVPLPEAAISDNNIL